MVDLMQQGVAQPERLVDITQVAALAQITPLPAGGVRIGALTPNSDMAAHPLIRERYPLLAEALLAGASPQLRNRATAGGNLMQRTRCYYFYDPGFEQCNKRSPGSGCAALQGFNRIHAVLGASEQCIATHPSDMCVALAALDAVVELRSSRGLRRLPLADFHRLPGDTPQLDTNVAPGELITAIELPPNGFAAHSHYLKLRDRQSYAFALVSVAAAVELDGNVIRDARLALGGVAHKPWPVPEAGRLLGGRPAVRESFAAVAEAALHGAKPRQFNAFKIELAKRAIVRALGQACA
jgi:xanthine dehydrogenase YagS FAD-binding subunit